MEVTKNRIAISFNGGKESLIVLHKYGELNIPADQRQNVIFRVDKNDDFPEVNDYIDFMCDKYHIKLVKFCDMKDSIVQLKSLYNVDTVILGCRRTDPHCSELKEYQMTDSSWPSIMRFNPLLDWSYKEVWNYIDLHQLPVCKLYEKGYTSLGSRYNSFPNYTLFDKDSYKHARELIDETMERCGRINNCNISIDETKLSIKFDGICVKGKGVATKLGYPTANLHIANYNSMNNIEGVYYGYCVLKNIKYKMVLIGGKNPEYGDSTIEVHILKFDYCLLYNESLSVEIIGFIRKMKKFETIDILIEAINNDIAIAKYHLKDEKQ